MDGVTYAARCGAERRKTEADEPGSLKLNRADNWFVTAPFAESPEQVVNMQLPHSGQQRCTVGFRRSLALEGADVAVAKPDLCTIYVPPGPSLNASLM